jgi:hypothetical protein
MSMGNPGGVKRDSVALENRRFEAVRLLEKKLVKSGAPAAEWLAENAVPEVTIQHIQADPIPGHEYDSP